MNAEDGGGGGRNVNSALPILQKPASFLPGCKEGGLRCLRSLFAHVEDLLLPPGHHSEEECDLDVQ